VKDRSRGDATHSRLLTDPLVRTLSTWLVRTVPRTVIAIDDAAANRPHMYWHQPASGLPPIQRRSTCHEVALGVAPDSSRSDSDKNRAGGRLDATVEDHAATVARESVASGSAESGRRWNLVRCATTDKQGRRDCSSSRRNSNSVAQDG
jgi:hypothetical protein